MEKGRGTNGKEKGHSREQKRKYWITGAQSTQV